MPSIYIYTQNGKSLQDFRMISKLPAAWNLPLGPQVLGVGVMIAFEEGGETGEAMEEGLIILALGLCPLHLGQC